MEHAGTVDATLQGNWLIFEINFPAQAHPLLFIETASAYSLSASVSIFAYNSHFPFFYDIIFNPAAH